MRYLLLLAFLPLGLCAQDFTIQSGQSFFQKDTRAASQALIVPVETNRIISQLDHRLSPEGDVQMMREKLRRALNRAVVRRFQDSLSVMDLSIQVDEEVNTVEFIYNGLDLRYAEVNKAQESSQLSLRERLIAKTKKKEDQGYKGAEVEVGQGQLLRRELNSSRYMAASFPDRIVSEHLIKSYPHDWMLVLTQLDILKSNVTSEGELRPYVVRLHYSFIDAEGKMMEGGLVEAYLSDEGLDTKTLSNDIFARLAEQLPFPTDTATERRPSKAVKVNKTERAIESDEDF